MAEYQMGTLSIFFSFVFQATLNTTQMDMVSVHEENDTGNVDQVARDFRQHLHLLPRLENL
jgi:hypothetical protein